MDDRAQFGNILNDAHPSILDILERHDWDPAALRPISNPDNPGEAYIVRTIKGKKTPIAVNAQYSQPKDAWVEYDTATILPAQPTMTLAQRFIDLGMVKNVPGGMGRLVVETPRTTDISQAIITMDPTVQSQEDRPLRDFVRTPLPIIHKDTSFNARELATSRMDGGSGVDTDTLAAASRRCLEAREMLTLGTWPETITYAGGTVYGLLSFPNRIVATLTTPTTSNQAVTIGEITGLMQTALLQYHKGPWDVYYSVPWSTYMTGDYNLYLGKTLKTRLLEIDGVASLQVLEYMRTGFTMLFVERDPQVFRLLNTIDLMLIQWQSLGGLRRHWKTILGSTPQPRCDIYGNCGIMVAAVP